MKYTLNKTGKNLLWNYNKFNSLATRFDFDRAIEKGMGNEDYMIAEALEIIDAEGPGTMGDIKDETGLWDELQPYLKEFKA